MMRLLWKEFRERRWWAAAWAAIMLATALFGGVQSFCGESTPAPLLTWSWGIWALLGGVLVGAGAYTAETSSDRASFLFARPVAWWQALLAKSLFAALVAIGASLLAALIFRLGCPAYLHGVATPANLLHGAVLAAWPPLAAYLLGLACSVVVAGVSGGVMTLIAVLLVFVTGSALWPETDTGELEMVILKQLLLVAGVSLGAIVAGLRLARFGLTLTQDERIKRFVLLFLPIAAVAILAVKLTPAAWIAERLTTWHADHLTVSSSGKYVYVYYSKRYRVAGTDTVYYPTDASYPVTGALYRLADGACVPLPGIDPAEMGVAYWQWLAGADVACVSDAPSQFCCLVMPETDRVIDLRRLAATYALSPMISAVSPDGRTVALAAFSRTRRPKGYLVLVDLQSSTFSVQPLPRLAGQMPAWWQDGDTIGYMPRGQRHLLEVPRP